MFKIRDYVKVSDDYTKKELRGKVGKIVCILLQTGDFGIEFPFDVDGHSCEGYSKYGYGWYIPKEHLTPVQQQFTKSDLRDGMIVATNEGTYVVCGERLVRQDGLMNLSDYEETLDNVRWSKDDDIAKEFDIQKVYSPNKLPYNLENMLDPSNSELLWERKEELLNGKFICTESKKTYFTQWKIYEFVDGKTRTDIGCIFPLCHEPFKNFSDLAEYSCSKFQQVVE